jgi:hypothetical protein
MAEVILSPGVFQIESDQSLYTQGPQVLGAAIVGPTVGGRPLVPTYVTTYTQYQSLFGDVFKSGSYYYEYFTSIAAREYFQNGGQTLLVTKIISGSASAATYATANVTSQPIVGVNIATGSTTLTASFTPGTEARITYGSTVYRFIGTGNPVPGNDIDGNVYFFLTGSTAAGTADALTGSINGALSGSTASSSVNLVKATSTTGGAFQLSASFAGSAYNGITFATGSGTTFSTIISLGGGTDTIGTVTSSFQLEAINWGTQLNNTSSATNGALESGSALNVRWEVITSDTGSGQFSIIIRRGDDNNSQKNILETWANLSLDPQLPNYVARIIGDLRPAYNSTTNIVEYTGNYGNNSKYVRVSSVTTPNVDSLDNNGNFKSGSYGQTLPSVGSGSYNGSFSGGVTDTTAVKQMNEFIGKGLNYTAPFTANNDGNIQGFAASDYTAAFTLLSNRDDYQFNVLMAPGVGLDTSAAAGMVSCVEGRGDAIAILGAGVYGTTITQATTNASAQSSNYAAAYYPWVQLYSSNLGKTIWCPPSTVIGGVLAFNDQVGAEWFAPAGLNRGGIPSVVRAERRLSQTDRDALYAKNINPLATFPGTGVCVWGQKTLQRKPTALDRVNVRRLLIALKGYIGQVSRNLVFEQNTTVTRNRFLSQVNPYLSSVVQRQGLYAFKVVMDDSNNTPDVVDRNQLVGQIYIQPTKTAEFIILNFNILPTGATFPA